MKQLREKKGLMSKDLITLSIFTLLYSICLFLVAGISGMIPIGFIFHAAIASIPCGIIYFYLRAKVPKKGSIMVQTLIFALIYFMVGNPVSVPIAIILGGLIAEVISASGNYMSFWKNTLGYCAVIVLTWLGFMFNMIFQKDYYMTYAVERGSSGAYVEQLINVANGPLFFVALGVTIIAAVLGALLGRKVLKKHFVKAGMV